MWERKEEEAGCDRNDSGEMFWVQTERNQVRTKLGSRV